MVTLEEIAARHDALKKRIHAFRVPIKSRLGLFGMGCIYFTTPLVAGWFLMQWSNGIRDTNLGSDDRRQKLLEAKQKWESMDAPQVVMAKTPKPHKVDIPTRQL